MLGGSNPFFSPHGDVLNATASSIDDAYKLVNECKNRGRNTVAAKRYPEALELYSKAISVLSQFVADTSQATQGPGLENQQTQADQNKLTSELAVLYSNRSLVRLQMNDLTSALQDATTATCYDDIYVKGHWRLGQAAMALKDYETAVSAFRKALQLEPQNKALFVELQKAEQQQIQQQNQQQVKIHDTSTNTDLHSPTPRLEDEQKSDPSPINHQTEGGGTGTRAETGGKETEEDNLLFSSSEHVRGYKLVNGKKTSFFHHEQTEKEKLLIGDIAPKRIDAATTPTTTHVMESTSSSTMVSAWNKAGTWEERDLTQVAITSLSDTLRQCTYTLPPGVAFAGSIIRVTNLSQLQSTKEGGTTHASIATVRGKKRLIFEFTVTVHWELLLIDEEEKPMGTSTTSSTNICKGSLTFPDVDGTHELGQGYDTSDYIVDKDTPSHAKFILERFVRDGGLRTILEQAMDQWIVQLRDSN